MDRIDIKAGYACNNNCSFCVVGPEERKIPLVSSDRIAKELASARANGAKEVAFSGGEPTIRKDILNLVAYARKIGYESVMIITNGRMLSSPAFVEKSKEAGVSTFMISIHGQENTHDSLTKSKGSYRQAMAGIENLKNNDIRFITDTVLTSTNMEDIPKIIPFLLDKGAEVCQIDFIIPCGSAWEHKELIPKMTEAMPAIEKTIEQAKASGNDRKISIMGIPACIMKDYKEYMNEPNIPKIGIVAGDKSHETKDYNKHRKKGKIKSDSCIKCEWNDRCEGVWDKYAELHGTEELVPL